MWRFLQLCAHYPNTGTRDILVDNFDAKANEIKDLAGEKRYRIWRVHLASCVYAFNQDWISTYSQPKSGKTDVFLIFWW
jgi:cyclopropane fatty-acyl-phospholipid synthase-like methyltransferase